MSTLIRFVLVILVCFLLYFFSNQLQKLSARILTLVSEKVGTFSLDKEYSLQRYVFLNRHSVISRVYNWINEQIISLGLKREGVTPMGYLCFWAILCIPFSLFVWKVLDMSVFSILGLYLVCYGVILLLTRVYVSSSIEKREMDIMDAMDLIVPDIKNGVQNAIVRYQDNFALSIRGDFKAFISNIETRGYPFDRAMHILSDSLGLPFRDFAQKCIFYEHLGEEDQAEIFANIVEQNSLKRQLRSDNTEKFASLKFAFGVSSIITAVYGVFCISTDEFTRNFLLYTNFGKILLVAMILTVVGVLSYITTVKARVI